MGTILHGVARDDVADKMRVNQKLKKVRSSWASISGRAKSKCNVLGLQTLDTQGEQARVGVVGQNRGSWSRQGQDRSSVGGSQSMESLQATVCPILSYLL